MSPFALAEHIRSETFRIDARIKSMLYEGRDPESVFRMGYSEFKSLCIFAEGEVRRMDPSYGLPIA